MIRRPFDRILPGWFRVVFVLALVLNGSLVVPGTTTSVSAQATPCIDEGPSGGTYVSRICIAAPTDGATVSGDMTTSVTVSSVSGQLPAVRVVNLYLNRSSSSSSPSLAADYESPYSLQVPTVRWVDGAYRLEARVTFADGYTTVARATIFLNFLNGVTKAPSSGGTWTPKTSGSSPLSIVAVGDGAGGTTGATNVGNLATSMNPDLFFYLGDVYNAGSYTEFYNYYGPTLGALDSRTNPVPGNHETGKSFTGYMDYWDSDKHYYSFDSGGWHFVALDSTTQFGQTAAGSTQYEWLRQDLIANANTSCTLVFFHHPRFGLVGGGSAYMQDIWSLLAEQGVDVVLTGHEHNYQRWHPMDGQGNLATDGIAQYVIGTGGHESMGFGGTDSRVANRLKADGVLSLTLGAGGGSARFITTSGATFDESTFNCHDGPPTGTPTPTATVTSTPDPGAPLTFGPVADATVSEANATTNYGSSTNLRSDMSPNEMAFLKFDVTGLTEPPAKATLRLYVRDGTGNAPAIATSGDTTWTESGITWQNKPAANQPFDDLGQVNTGTWIEYDVTGQVTANGQIAFALVPQSTDALSVNSKENSTNQPELVIQRTGSTTPTPTSSVTPTPTASTSFTSAADARVEEANPANNYGSSTVLRADGGSDPDVESYLRFTVSGLTGAPESATVRLFVPTNTNAGSVNGPALYGSSSNSWSEGAITWNNRPARTGTVYGDLGAVNPGTWIEFDVTSAITGNGDYSFVLASSSSDATDVASKESTSPPQLIISTLATGTPTATASATPGTPTATTTATTTATATVTATVPSTPAASLSLEPVDDAMVQENFPTSNYGKQNNLRSDASPNEAAYLKFNVQGLSGAPTKATLRLWVRDGTANAPGVARSQDTSWDETTITWSSRPAPGTIASDLERVSAGTWIEYDVTSLVTGNGAVTLVLVAQTGDALSVNSKENSTGRPVLVLEQSGASATPSPSATATATATSTATATATSTPVSTTIGPVADARVALSNPTTNYGSTSTLLADTSPMESSYLRFDVPAPGGTVTSATLRLWVVDSTSNAPAIATSADTSWDESTITWNSRPAVGPTIADLGSISSGTWVTYDVTSAITGPGPITFVLVAQSSNGADFGSRESTNPPQLIINSAAANTQDETARSSMDVMARSAVPGTEPPATPAATPTLEPALTPDASPVATTDVVMGTVVNTDGVSLRCRTSPSLEGEVIVQLPEGSQVIVRGPAEGDWLPVVCGDQDGYVAAQFILLPASGDTSGAAPTEQAPEATVDPATVPEQQAPPPEEPVVEPSPTETTVVEPTPTPLPIVNGWQDDPAVPWWWTTDLDQATTWSGYVNDPVEETEFGYDLGSISPVSHLRWRPTWPMQGTVEIQLSNDGVNWYRLSRIELPWERADEWVDVPVHTEARYINFVFTNPSGAGNVGAISEIEVWAEPGGIAGPIESLTLIVPTPVPTPEPPPTEEPVATEVPVEVPPEPTQAPVELPVTEPTEVPPVEQPVVPTEEAIPDGT